MSNQPDLNPYSVSTSTLAASIDSDAESVRRKHLSHEASVKSIGLLYWLGGIIGVLLTLVYIVAGIFLMSKQETMLQGLVVIVVGIVFGCFFTFQIFVAMGIGKLSPWSRIAATVLSCIGLLGFPLGTLISAYFLYLLQSSKGVFVFSDEYKEVIAATPHIKYKTSIIVWILLALLVGVIAIAAFSIAFVGVTKR